MIIVTLIKKIDSGEILYYPLMISDQHLMQHLVNEDLEALNEKGLSKAKYVAAAHDWKIEVS